jgi:hypothetical protein
MMQQRAQDGRNGSSYTFGSGYPAPMRIPLRGRYLAKMALLMVGTVALGIAVVLYFWPLARHPAGTSHEERWVIFMTGAGFAAIVVGLYYFVYGAIWAAQGQTGVILDAQGYTDSTMLTQLTSVRMLWGNVRSITTETDEGASYADYVWINLTDDSVYKSYSSLKRLMTHTVYRRYTFFGPMLPGIGLGLWGDRDVILARGLPVDAQSLAALMNSYLKAWRKEHRHASQLRIPVIVTADSDDRDRCVPRVGFCRFR